ncbi:MAG TPA: DNA translocase FtsK 4TM domain-containing protein [Myxococcales bacterium]|nr:DNA translocase FtsK 4TM domain-containing protein [Myxococcales bacterium]
MARTHKRMAERNDSSALRGPVAGILLGGVAVLAFLALASYSPRHGVDWAGPIGRLLAEGLLEAAGIGAYGIVLLLAAVSSTLVAGRPRLSLARAGSWIVFSACAMALVDLAVPSPIQGHAPGGALGFALASFAEAGLSTWGAGVLLAASACAALVVATDLWALRAAFAAGKLGIAGSALAARGAGVALSRSRDAWALALRDAFGDEPPEEAASEKKPSRRKALEIVPDAEVPQDPRLPVASASEPPPKQEDRPPIEPVPPPTIVVPRPALPREGERAPEPRKEPVVARPAPEAAAETPSPRRAASYTLHGGRTSFTLPPISLLTGEAQALLPIDREGLTATAEKLRQKLASFGIQGQVTRIRPGPVVTMFEFLPASGVKVSRIASLADDLAMAMEAMRVRIVAPIPGKGVVGIEIPNKERQLVVLRELCEQEAFQKSQSKLAMCLGKDIEGMPYIADLGRMPHLLIAGTTGSGKSVAVNSMIVSMLLRATPEEVRFLMVDPKMLELSVYEGIPHLLLPVVTDAKKAAMALRWAVEEMERRYQLLAECGVRNIASYNKKVEKEGDGALLRHNRSVREKKPAEPAEAEGTQGDLPLDSGREPLRRLPYLVLIIDELADLMMVASREVETYIARLAQMARAAGIHLMVATQRPSTDVVTGVIKANFPARISFQVASRHDSGTIINAPGAENLLGMGDMLILPPGTSTLTRVHGPYVEEKEINAVVEYWKAQGAPVYDPSILRPRADEDGLADDDEGPDELYDHAIAAVADMRFVSISLLQRKLRVGYNRAARMIERMEREGIVGPADGAKPREVLIRPVGEMPDGAA